jgi:AcrR family transcriptional regulator
MEARADSRHRYHSPRRQEQARLTRRAILDTALAVFVERGYLATPLAGIAQRAGVALATIQAIFGTKARLLAVLWDLVTAGDDAVIPVVEREWFQEMAPTGKRVTMTAIHVLRLADGKLAETWGESDALGMSEQLERYSSSARLISA